MNWFNWIGMILVALLLLPNILYAIRRKNEENNQKKIILQILEQIGRYGVMLFMIFNIPYTYLGFYFAHAQMIYILINLTLMLGYYLSWIFFWKKNCLIKSMLLSVIPSILFLFSGIMIVSIPLIIFATIFAVFHIWISIKK